MLTKAGYTTLVTDPNSPLAAETSGQVPDVVVVDCVQKGEKIITLVSRIREWPGLALTPLLLCSQNDKVKEELSDDRQIQELLVKPFQSDKLVAAVDKLTCQKRVQVLIIENEDLIRERLKQVLMEEGYAVVTAESAEEGLALLTHPFDVIVADIGLPKMTGLELTKIIKQRHPTLRVVLVTGLSHKYSRDLATEAGAHAYLSKPFRNETFLETVRESTTRA